MKMDIEGFEYVVLPDLIHSGAICDFRLVFGEFHPTFAPIRNFRKGRDGGDAGDGDDDGNGDGNGADGNGAVDGGDGGADGGDDDPDFDSYHRIPLESKREARKYADSLKTVIESSRHCRVRFLDNDDESYNDDGMPLPSPTRQDERR